MCGPTAELSGRQDGAIVATIAARKRYYAGLLVVGILLAAVVGLFGLPKVALGQTLPPTSQKPAFDPPITLNYGQPAVRPQVAVSGDDTHVVWKQDGDQQIGGIWRRKISRGGSTPDREPDKISPDGAIVWDPDVAASGNHAYAVWHQRDPSLEGSTREVWFASSAEGWTPKRLSGTSSPADLYPKVTASGEHVAVIWSSSDGRVYFRASSNGGRVFDEDFDKPIGRNEGVPVDQYDVAVRDTSYDFVWADSSGHIKRLSQ